MQKAFLLRCRKSHGWISITSYKKNNNVYVVGFTDERLAQKTQLVIDPRRELKLIETIANAQVNRMFANSGITARKGTLVVPIMTDPLAPTVDVEPYEYYKFDLFPDNNDIGIVIPDKICFIDDNAWYMSVIVVDPFDDETVNSDI